MGRGFTWGGASRGAGPGDGASRGAGLHVGRGLGTGLLDSGCRLPLRKDELPEFCRHEEPEEPLKLGRLRRQQQRRIRIKA
ncbi:Beta-secretase 1 [Dissostichus eleginoides]|uniref:Beta-secretase 1 n=1 Tax=Dissostichus eleginoides TaxID=100907 RepID=A0AAD9B0V1_DISEL|nr:Beta-secretase 1 [Dissostichus eleginoides]